MTYRTALALAVLLASTPASAVVMDISDLAGFTHSGASGTSGNGVLWVSPKYFFEPGTTIDFGTATVIGDPADHRYGCGLPGQSLCLAGAGWMKPYLLTDGLGGWPTSDFNITGPCRPIAGTDYCAPGVFHLLFTLGPNNDGIQLAFQGSSLNIVPVPLPAAWLLFITGLGVASLFRRTQ